MEKKIGKIKGFFAEFKKFITRGNVLDMAVGVIIGGAFTAIVNGLSNYVLKPIINWLIMLMMGPESAGGGLSSAVTFLPDGKVYKDILDESGAIIGQEIDMTASLYIDWGSLISAILNFLIVAFVLFLIIRTMNRVAAARERLAEGIDFDEKMEVRKIRKEQKLSMKEAKALYLERLEAAKAKKAEEERLVAEKAAAEEAAAAAIAEEKAMANTRLLEEIRDLLKNK